MPLVRISYKAGRPDGFGATLGDLVHRAMVETIKVPADDRFQLVTEHPAAGVVYDAGYLGVSRTDGIVMIQVTLNEGRTVEMKRAFYRAVADKAAAELGLRPQDVLISLVEVKKENWSFGNGEAQYA